MSWTALAQEIQKIPPITRLFMGSAILIAGPLFAKLYNPRVFAFTLPLIAGKLQIYRIYTSFWIPWRLDDPLKWLFDMVMLWRHLKPIEEKSYSRRPADMAWQFFWSAIAIQVLCYPLHLPFFWTPMLGFIVYLSSRLAPNESISLYGLFTLNVQWFPYVLVAFDMVMSPLIACGTIVGLIVAQALYMLEYDSPPEGSAAEPTLKPTSILRAPDWLTRLMVEPEAPRRVETVPTAYGQATAPAGRAFRDSGRGANTTTTTTGYQWGRGHRLGGE